MPHLFRLSDEAWAAIDRHLMFSRPDAVGETFRPNMVRPPRSTIATTDGRSAGFGSACSSRLQLLAMFLASSASTVRM